MATDLDGVFNFGLNGLRDRKVFDQWLKELKLLKLPRAQYYDDDDVLHEEQGEWEYEVSGYGGDDPYESNDQTIPFQVIFEGPYMYKIILMDNIAQLPTFYRLYILFEQPYFFEEFITEVRRVLAVFGANEMTWLSSFGNASYSSVYQEHVWENKSYDEVKKICIQKYGQAMNYFEAKEYEEKHGIAYANLDRFVVDRFV